MAQSVGMLVAVTPLASPLLPQLLLAWTEETPTPTPQPVLTALSSSSPYFPVHRDPSQKN